MVKSNIFQLNYQRDQVAAIKDKQQEKEQTDDREHSQVHSCTCISPCNLQLTS